MYVFVAYIYYPLKYDLFIIWDEDLVWYLVQPYFWIFLVSN
jgi:hypothetical protein